MPPPTHTSRWNATMMHNWLLCTLPDFLDGGTWLVTWSNPTWDSYFWCSFWSSHVSDLPISDWYFWVAVSQGSTNFFPKSRFNNVLAAHPMIILQSSMGSTSGYEFEFQFKFHTSFFNRHHEWIFQSLHFHMMPVTFAMSHSLHYSPQVFWHTPVGIKFELIWILICWIVDWEAMVSLSLWGRTQE
jgi:hypothetical protein